MTPDMTRRTAITTTALAVGGLVVGCGKEKKMVKHVILWKLKDDVTDKDAVKAGIKAGLEGLKGVVPGLTDIIVRTFNDLLNRLRSEHLRLEEQYTFLSLLIEASPMGIVQCDLEGNITSMNPAAQQMLSPAIE